MSRVHCVFYGLENRFGLFAEITGKLEDVVNRRGRAYAARNRARYRRDRTKK
jgi:hypothetical protein